MMVLMGLILYVARVYAWNEPSSPNVWSQRGSDIDGPTEGGLFGDYLSLSSDGNIVAIGASQNDGANGENSGLVRVYAWNEPSSPNVWSQRGGDIEGEGSAIMLGLFHYQQMDVY